MNHLQKLCTTRNNDLDHNKTKVTRSITDLNGADVNRSNYLVLEVLILLQPCLKIGILSKKLHLSPQAWRNIMFFCK
ncbi:hypothetical protein J2T20_000074 [Paenibacillus wynnii]|nr:hypothetical protein [Paenibacillus wynnii]